MNQQLALPNAKEIATKIQQTKQALRELAQSELALRDNAHEIHRRAWIVGALLADLKEEIGHGKWLLWLPAKFSELGKTDSARTENASRCIRFFKDNPQDRLGSNVGNSRYLKPPREFGIDSVRKLMWNYIPEKERPQLPGNEEVNPEPHYLTFANHWTRFRRQASLGRVTLPPIETMRRDLEPVARDMIDLLGRDWFFEILKH